MIDLHVTLNAIKKSPIIIYLCMSFWTACRWSSFSVGGGGRSGIQESPVSLQLGGHANVDMNIVVNMTVARVYTSLSILVKKKKKYRY